jgi:AAT family amino acid transporter
VGPYLCVILNSFLVLVQGWSCFSPRFSGVDFVSYYIELPIMLVMYVAWKLIKRTKIVSLSEMDLETDVYVADEAEPEKKPMVRRLRRIATWFI